MTALILPFLPRSFSRPFPLPSESPFHTFLFIYNIFNCLGIILLSLLTGRTPFFSASDPFQALLQIAVFLGLPKPEDIPDRAICFQINERIYQQYQKNNKNPPHSTSPPIIDKNRFTNDPYHFLPTPASPSPSPSETPSPSSSPSPSNSFNTNRINLQNYIQQESKMNWPQEASKEKKTKNKK